MEYIDVIDEQGKNTGEKIEKSKIYNGEDSWHRTIHVMIVNSKNEVLLQKRSNSKRVCPGLWDLSISSHVKAGEECIDAVKREALEELGINIEEENLEYLFELKSDNFEDGGVVYKEFCNVYILRLDIKLEDMILQEEEVEAVKWMSLNDFAHMVSSKSKDLINSYQMYEGIVNKLKNI